MRCIECVTEPITPGHFCECCGRKLSLEERKGLEVAAPAPALVEPIASAQRCESCGGQSDDGPLCAACRQVLHVFLGQAEAAPVVSSAAVAVPPAVPAEPPLVDGYPEVQLESPGDLAARQIEEVAEAMRFDAPVAEAVRVDDPFAVADVHAVQQVAVVEQPLAAQPLTPIETLLPFEAVPPAEVSHPVDAVTPADAVKPMETVKPAEAPKLAETQKPVEVAAPATESVKIEAVKEAPVRKDEPPKARAVQNDTRRPAPKIAAQPAASKRAAQPRGWIDRLIAVAAVLLVLMGIGLGAGANWLKVRNEPVAEHPGPSPVAQTASVTERAPSSAEVAEAAAIVHKELSAAERKAPEPVAAPKIKPAAAASPRTTNAARQVSTPQRQVASVAAPARVELPAREEPPPPVAVAAPAPAPVAAAPASVASAEPLRPFFEPRDVNEAPQVATRVETRLPEELRGREISDVVVVRLLVSQTGHPSSVSLLRKSKVGQSLDDAVMASVKQWTFSPAKKKGEAVSCWLNVGVPVGRAN